MIELVGWLVVVTLVVYSVAILVNLILKGAGFVAKIAAGVLFAVNLILAPGILLFLGAEGLWGSFDLISETWSWILFISGLVWAAGNFYIVSIGFRYKRATEELVDIVNN